MTRRTGKTKQPKPATRRGPGRPTDEQRRIRAIAEELARSLAYDCISAVQTALRAYALRGERMRPRARA